MTDFEAVTRAFSEAGVEFVIVGGLAATIHGSARLTQHIDCVYSRSRANVERLVAALGPHAPYLRGAPPGLPFEWSEATFERGFNFKLTTAVGDIDLLGEIAGGGDYDALAPHTVDVDVFGCRCRCLDLPGLIRAKRAAGRPKDLDALAELEALLEERDISRGARHFRRRGMARHAVVTHDEWVSARKALLEREKAFTRERDALSRLRRQLPWEKVEKPYVFDGPGGAETLADLFAGRSQLIVYHFMFDPDWDEGCKSCSFLADHYEPAIVHLAQRDVTLVTVSRAPLARIEAFRERMGWRFKWVSSLGSDFNRDYQVTFSPEDLAGGEVCYNYSLSAFPMTEGPGISVFCKDDSGDVFHTYSSYARGLDMFIGAYHLLDIVPKGRDEDALDFSMEWIRHHDRYGEAER